MEGAASPSVGAEVSGMSAGAEAITGDGAEGAEAGCKPR